KREPARRVALRTFERAERSSGQRVVRNCQVPPGVGGDWGAAGSVVVDDGSVLVGVVVGEASVVGDGSVVVVAGASFAAGSVLVGAVALVSAGESPVEVEESVLAGAVVSGLAGGVSPEASGLAGGVLPAPVESVPAGGSVGSVPAEDVEPLAAEEP